MATLSIAKDFSSRPGGRTKVMGPGSGEAFRDLILSKIKRSPDEIFEVVLDGTEGYGSSFLEEAFGGIIRLDLMSPEDALKRIKIVALTRNYESYAIEAKRYMQEAANRKINARKMSK